MRGTRSDAETDEAGEPVLTGGGIHVDYCRNGWEACLDRCPSAPPPPDDRSQRRGCARGSASEQGASRQSTPGGPRPSSAAEETPPRNGGWGGESIGRQTTEKSSGRRTFAMRDLVEATNAAATNEASCESRGRKKRRELTESNPR